MKVKIRYIWTDEDNMERITKEPPINACKGCMGGYYTPNWAKVVLIEVEEE